MDQTELEARIAALSQELSAAVNQQAAMSEILQTISRSPHDLQPVLDTVAERAARLCDAFDALIFLRSGDQLVQSAHFGPIRVETAAFPISNDWASGRAVLTQLPQHIVDLQNSSEYPASRRVAQSVGFRTMLVVPLIREQAAVGTFVIRRTEVRPFTQKQIELVTTFADQAVIAIENTRLFEEVRARTHELEVSTQELNESLQQQTATADVLKVISRSVFDLQVVLDTLTSSAAKLCDADMGSIARQRGERFYYATNYNLPHDWLEYVKNKPMGPDRGSVIGRALLDQKVIQITDVLADPEYTFLDSAKAVWFRTLLGVPLMREGSPIGVISLARQDVRAFSAKQIELLQTFADQAVIAIENTRLFEEVQARTRELEASSQELNESLQQQTATADVLKTISQSTFDLKTVLQTLVESAARLCDADRATITRQMDGVFYDAESYGLSPEVMDIIRTIPINPDLDQSRGAHCLRAKWSRFPMYKRIRSIPFRRKLRSLAVFERYWGSPCSGRGSRLAFSRWDVLTCAHSLTGRSNLCRHLLTKRRLRLRMPGCST